MNKDVLDTVNFLPDQLWEAWEESQEVVLPETYKNFKRVLVCGMGGSALGGRVVKSFAFDKANACIEVLTDYNLPAYVDSETLVIASSYSGNTEETVSALGQVVEKRLPVFVIAAGGKLIDIARENGLPVYILNPKFNPSGQPRLAVGYSIGAIFGVLAKVGILVEAEVEIREVVDYLKIEQQDLMKTGEALANSIAGKLPVIVASEHLTGAAHVMKNQLNETAKSFSVLFDLPELNHHLMEGLKNPKEATEKLLFVFVKSGKYHERVQKRYALTKEVVEKNDIKTYELSILGKSKLSEVFSLLQVGSYVQAYLGAIYGEDPLSIPWVDYFKEKLA